MAQVMSNMPRIRLQYPWVRENGVLRKASWDEALKRAAGLFLDVKREYGGGSLGIFSCSKSTNELNYLASKFSRVVFGSNNIDSCNRT